MKRSRRKTGIKNIQRNECNGKKNKERGIGTREAKDVSNERLNVAGCSRRCSRSIVLSVRTGFQRGKVKTYATEI